MSKEIAEAFKGFENQNILIIGDVMIDAYMWGKVERISPEAPVPVISITSHENRLGGAANVALNIQALGAKPLMCAMIGNDGQGLIFKNLLENNHMDSKGILVSDKRKTTIKTRVISHNQHLLRIDEEVDKALITELEEQFINHIDQLFKQYKFDAVIFEDYDKGNITPAIIDFVVKKSNEKQIPTLVDPKKRNFDKYKGVTLFKPNFKEICEGLKIDLPKGDFEALHKASIQLKNILGAKYIMVTLSELGVFITNDSTFHQFPAVVRDIADVSGAGDTVISVAACCMAAGLSTGLIAIIANIAGGLVCEKVGVVPINKQQLYDEIIRLKI